MNCVLEELVVVNGLMSAEMNRILGFIMRDKQESVLKIKFAVLNEVFIVIRELYLDKNNRNQFLVINSQISVLKVQIQLSNYGKNLT